MKTITPKDFTRHSDVGPTVTVPDTPLAIFKLFFTANIIQYIVDQTNKYALQCMSQVVYASWIPVTVAELEAYMGFMILMGIVQLPSVYDYWKRDPIYHYSPITSRISRLRFMEINRYLHFADNSTLASSGTPQYNKLGKIEKVLQMLVEKFKENFNLNKHVSVDEAMIPFKGRSTLKQYMPLKPVKQGFKVCVLADATLGYVSNLEVYTGKKKDKSEDGLGETVVMNLCKDIEQK